MQPIHIHFWDEGIRFPLAFRVQTRRAARAERTPNHPLFSPAFSLNAQTDSKAALPQWIAAKRINLADRFSGRTGFLCLLILFCLPGHAGAQTPGGSATIETNAVRLTNAAPTSAVSRSERTNSAPASVSSNRMEFPAFRIISERNIFNPNRSGRMPQMGNRSREVRTETFSLVGIMSYAKGDFAFFDGSSSQYRRTLQQDGSIAGYKIAEIGSDHVKLQAEGKEIKLDVGMQMRRQEQGEWRVSSSSTPAPSASTSRPASDETAASTSSSTNPDSASTPASGSSAEDELLKKLMQQREQELNK